MHDYPSLPSISSFTSQTLPVIGVRFDVTVTQVDRPNLVFIQRCPPTDNETLLADDSIDPTASNAYSEISELEELSYKINQESFFREEKLDGKAEKGIFNPLTAKAFFKKTDFRLRQFQL